MSAIVTPLRTETWERDDRTAMVDVQTDEYGSQVVVVSLELLRQMLYDLGYRMTGHHQDNRNDEGADS